MMKSGTPFDGTIEYDSENREFRTYFDPSTESASAIVVEAIAALEGRDSTEMDSLYNAIDPDALDGLIDSSVDSDRNHIHVDFSTNGYEVSVRSDGKLFLRPQ